jgi:hypothetical protein
MTRESANQTPRIIREDGRVEYLDIRALANTEGDISFWYELEDEEDIFRPGKWTRIKIFVKRLIPCL